MQITGNAPKGPAGLIGDLLACSRFQFFGQVDQSVSTIDRSALCASLQRTDKGSALTLDALRGFEPVCAQERPLS